MESHDKFYCVAPMMGRTDSFFCYLLNLINKELIVYTEMMHAEKILRTNILKSYSKLINIKNIVLYRIASNDC